ncbi:MAG: hypothetical protein V4733_07990 [Verrucomicrobiota bacterium]
MKSILYVVAILAIGGACWFTNVHKAKFAEQQTTRLETIKLEKETAERAKAEETIRDSEKNILATKTGERNVLQEQISGLEDVSASLKRDVAAKDEQIKEQSAQFAALNAAMEELNKILAELGGGVTIDNLPAKIEEVNNDLKAKQNKLEETNTLITSAEKALASARGEEDRLHKRLGERSSRISRNAMESVITAVNQDWGFIVIGAGSNSGFTPQTSLLVERDGRLIGKVKPSAIEPTQTIAEIDFDSLAPGVRLQPGDKVILQTPIAN